MNKYLFLSLMILSYGAYAKNTDVEATEALTVERSVSSDVELSYPNDDNINPKVSDFEVLNYVLMSNEVGERWGVITLTNLSYGRREFDQDHLLALFADGSRTKPLEYKLDFKGNETKTVTVSFGKSKFPILTIYSSN